MTKEELEELVPVIIEKDLYVISDEIYAELTYGGKRHCSIGSLPGMKERTIVINGFSKAFSMTGWRIGYVIAPLCYMEPLTLHSGFQISGIATYNAEAAAAALNDDAKYHTVDAMRAEFEKRRNF